MSWHPLFRFSIAVQFIFVFTIGLIAFTPDSAKAQVACPNIALASLAWEAEDIGPGPGDTCNSVNTISTLRAFANGFKILPVIITTSQGGFDVVARVNGVLVTPTVICSARNPNYSTVGSSRRVIFGNTPFNSSCTVSYSDQFGETVTFTFQTQPEIILGVMFFINFNPLIVSTGGFDNVAPTVVVGAASAASGNTYTVPVTFSENVSGLAPSDLVVTNGVVTYIAGSGANYVATITPTSSAPISVSVPAAVVVDQGQNPNTAAPASASIASNTATELVISNYLQSRAVNILQSQIRLTDFLNPTTKNSFYANGSGGSDAGTVEFSGALGGADAQSGVQVWARASGVWSETALTQSSFFTAQAGLHALLGPDVVLGAMLQLDQTDGQNTSNAMTSNFEGWGWMVGPYIAAKLPNQPLFLEARIAWGQSYNDISPFGTYTDDFDTERWLLTGRVEGDFVAGDWSFNPAVRLSYFREEQEAYTDSLSNAVRAQTIALGEVEFGPTLRRSFALESGDLLQAELGISGLWTFAADGGLAGNQSVLNEDDLRARVNAALRYETETGWSLASDVFVDGLGVTDYSSVGGNLKVLRAF